MATLPTPNTSSGALLCPVSTCTQEEVGVSHLPLRTALSLCPFWGVVFPAWALSVGGMTVVGKGFETRRAGSGKRQPCPSRAARHQPIQVLVQFRRCLFL